jgi:hypothetical protein
MSLAARDSEFRRWSGRVDRRICQTFAASPAEPGELPLGFSGLVRGWLVIGRPLDAPSPARSGQAGIGVQ